MKFERILVSFSASVGFFRPTVFQEKFLELVKENSPNLLSRQRYDKMRVTFFSRLFQTPTTSNQFLFFFFIFVVSILSFLFFFFFPQTVVANLSFFFLVTNQKRFLLLKLCFIVVQLFLIFVGGMLCYFSETIVFWLFFGCFVLLRPVVWFLISGLNGFQKIIFFTTREKTKSEFKRSSQQKILFTLYLNYQIIKLSEEFLSLSLLQIRNFLRNISSFFPLLLTKLNQNMRTTL